MSLDNFTHGDWGENEMNISIKTAAMIAIIKEAPPRACGCIDPEWYKLTSGGAFVVGSGGAENSFKRIKRVC